MMQPTFLATAGFAAMLASAPLALPQGSWTRTAFVDGAFVRSMRYDTIEEKMEVRSIETYGSVTHVQDEAFDVGFNVAAFDSRTSGEFYLAGEDGSGAVVVQRWLLPPQTGGYRSTRARAVQLGVPYTTPATQFGVVGGSFIEPSLRSPRGVQRRTLWSGSSIGAVTSIAVDPDGRYLLLASSETAAVYKLDIRVGPKQGQLPGQPPPPPPPVPVRVIGASDVPDLDVVDSIHGYDHLALGRVFRVHFRPGASAYAVLIPDNDNDGFFESPIVYSDEAYVSDDIGSGWIRDFRTSF